MKKMMRKRPRVLFQKIVDTLVVYIRTQCVVMVAVSAVTWIILVMLGVRFALLLAITTGALAAVPVLGMITSAVIAAVVATFDDLRFLPGAPEAVEGIVVIVAYVLLNMLVDLFLTPYLTGKMIRIHPALIFFSVLIGSVAFGIPGALFAVPVLLIGKTVWEHFNSQ